MDNTTTMIEKSQKLPPEYGEIPGIEFGHTWSSRSECSKSGFHTPMRAGIWGDPETGARSVILSGGYIDDLDYGDNFIYTGRGGHNSDGQGHRRNGSTGTKEIVEDQDPNHHDNRALRKSIETGVPVRVIRGPSPYSLYSPEKGYRYDGLYKVIGYEYSEGKNAGCYKVCKFTFKRYTEDGQVPLPIPKRW